MARALDRFYYELHRGQARDIALSHSKFLFIPIACIAVGTRMTTPSECKWELLASKLSACAAIWMRSLTRPEVREPLMLVGAKLQVGGM